MQLRVAFYGHFSRQCFPYVYLSFRPSRGLCAASEDENTHVRYLIPSDNFQSPDAKLASLEQRRLVFCQRVLSSAVKWDTVTIPIDRLVHADWAHSSIQIHLIATTECLKAHKVRLPVDTHIATMVLCPSVISKWCKDEDRYVTLEPHNGKCTLVLDLAFSKWIKSTWRFAAHAHRPASLEAQAEREQDVEIMKAMTLKAAHQVAVLSRRQHYCRFQDRGNCGNRINLGDTLYIRMEEPSKVVYRDLYRSFLPGALYIYSLTSHAPTDAPSPSLFYAMLQVVKFQLELNLDASRLFHVGWSVESVDKKPGVVSLLYNKNQKLSSAEETKEVGYWLCTLLVRLAACLSSLIVYYPDCEDLCPPSAAAAAAPAVLKSLHKAADDDVRNEDKALDREVCTSAVCLRAIPNKKGQKQDQKRMMDEFHSVLDTKYTARAGDDCETETAASLSTFLHVQDLHKHKQVLSYSPMLVTLSHLACQYVPLLVYGTLVKGGVRDGQVRYHVDSEEELRLLQQKNRPRTILSESRLMQHEAQQPDADRLVCHVYMIPVRRTLFDKWMENGERVQKWIDDEELDKPGSYESFPWTKHDKKHAPLPPGEFRLPTLLVESTECSFPFQDSKRVPASFLDKTHKTKVWKALKRRVPILEATVRHLTVEESDGYDLYLTASTAYSRSVSWGGSDWVGACGGAAAGSGELRFFNQATSLFGARATDLFDPDKEDELALLPIGDGKAEEVIAARVLKYMPPSAFLHESSEPFQAAVVAKDKDEEKKWCVRSSHLHCWARHGDWVSHDMAAALDKAGRQFGFVVKHDTVHVSRGQQEVLIRISWKSDILERLK